jgi:hypothetical protein
MQYKSSTHDHAQKKWDAKEGIFQGMKEEAENCGAEGSPHGY